MIHNTTLKKLHVQTQAEARGLQRARVCRVVQEEANLTASSVAEDFLWCVRVQLYISRSNLRAVQAEKQNQNNKNNEKC